MRIALVMIMLLMAVPVLAAVYEKVDDSLKVTSTIEQVEQLTIQQIKHEIAGIDADLSRIEESYLKQKDEFLQRKYKYEEMLNKCVELDIKEPVIIEPKEEPIEEPKEPIDG